jgi:hypothetical protein
VPEPNPPPPPPLDHIDITSPAKHFPKNIFKKFLKMSLNKLSIDKVDVAGKRVLVR